MNKTKSVVDDLKDTLEDLSEQQVNGFKQKIAAWLNQKLDWLKTKITNWAEGSKTEPQVREEGVEPTHHEGTSS